MKNNSRKIDPPNNNRDPNSNIDHSKTVFVLSNLRSPLARINLLANRMEEGALSFLFGGDSGIPVFSNSLTCFGFELTILKDQFWLSFRGRSLGLHDLLNPETEDTFRPYFSLPITSHNSVLSPNQQDTFYQTTIFQSRFLHGNRVEQYFGTINSPEATNLIDASNASTTYASSLTHFPPQTVTENSSLSYTVQNRSNSDNQFHFETAGFGNSDQLPERRDLASFPARKDDADTVFSPWNLKDQPGSLFYEERPYENVVVQGPHSKTLRPKEFESLVLFWNDTSPKQVHTAENEIARGSSNMVQSVFLRQIQLSEPSTVSTSTIFHEKNTVLSDSSFWSIEQVGKKNPEWSPKEYSSIKRPLAVTREEAERFPFLPESTIRISEPHQSMAYHQFFVESRIDPQPSTLGNTIHINETTVERSTINLDGLRPATKYVSYLNNSINTAPTESDRRLHTILSKVEELGRAMKDQRRGLNQLNRDLAWLAREQAQAQARIVKAPEKASRSFRLHSKT